MVLSKTNLRAASARIPSSANRLRRAGVDGLLWEIARQIHPPYEPVNTLPPPFRHPSLRFRLLWQFRYAAPTSRHLILQESS